MACLDLGKFVTTCSGGACLLGFVKPSKNRCIDEATYSVWTTISGLGNGIKILPSTGQFAATAAEQAFRFYDPHAIWLSLAAELVYLPLSCVGEEELVFSCSKGGRRVSGIWMQAASPLREFMPQPSSRDLRFSCPSRLRCEMLVWQLCISSSVIQVKRSRGEIDNILHFSFFFGKYQARC